MQSPCSRWSKNGPSDSLPAMTRRATRLCIGRRARGGAACDPSPASRITRVGNALGGNHRMRTISHLITLAFERSAILARWVEHARRAASARGLDLPRAAPPRIARGRRGQVRRADKRPSGATLEETTRALVRRSDPGEEILRPRTPRNTAATVIHGFQHVHRRRAPRLCSPLRPATMRGRAPRRLVRGQRVSLERASPRFRWIGESAR